MTTTTERIIFPSTTKTSQPSKRQADPNGVPRFLLTERDRRIVRAVYEYRALTTAQVEALFFSAGEVLAPGQKLDTRCQHRLRLLSSAGYLFRDEQPTKRSEGRKPYVYFLNARGVELLCEVLEVSAEDFDWRPQDNDVTWLFLSHLLATNDVRIAITTAALRHGWTLTRWLDDRTLRRAEMKEYVELPTKTGGSRRVALVPDGYFALRVASRTYHRFLEIDLGTVTASASKEERRDWRRKVEAYLGYYGSGGFLRRYGAQGMRVLTVTTSERRLQTLTTVTENAGGRQLFLFTTQERLRGADALTDAIWTVPHTPEPQAIVSAA